MADHKLMTEKQTAELIGKTIQNLQIEIDLSDYQTSEDGDLLRSELEAELAKKVDKSEYNSKVGELESSINDLEAQIPSLKQTVAGVNADLGELKGNVTSLETQLSNAESTIGSLQSELGTLSSTVANKVDQSAFESAMNEVNGDLRNKVDQSAYDIKVQEIESSLKEKASKSEFDDLKEVVNTKASKSELTSLGESLQEEFNNKLTAVYRYKGSKDSVEELPLDGSAVVGDVYDVANGMNYAWNGTSWDALGESRIEVDAALNATSTNPVQNKVIKAALDQINTDIEEKTDIKMASSDNNGLMSSADYDKLASMDIANQTEIDAAYTTHIAPKLKIDVIL